MFHRIPPYILLIIAPLLWGGNFVFGRAIINELSPFTLSFLRWVIALIIFFPIAYPSLKRDWKKIKKQLPIVFFMALTGLVTFNVTVYYGLHFTTAINASLVNATTPILIYILSFFFLKERLTKLQIIGSIISLFGVLLIISKGSLISLFHLSFNYGDLIMLIAVINWGTYSLLLKRYADELPGQSTFLMNIIVSTFILTPFFIYDLINPNISLILSIKSISAIIYIGIFASIVAFLCWNNGVVRVGANRAGIYLNLTPVFATLFAVLFIDESLYLFQILGGILVGFGVYLSSKRKVVNE